MFNAATDIGIELKFNLQIRHDSTIEWAPVLELVEGVDITMGRIQAFDKDVTSSARFVTLRMSTVYDDETGCMTIHEDDSTALRKIGAQFPHVRDLRLVFDNGGNTSPSSGLHLNLGHLEKLSKLHTLHIRSDIFPSALQLPKNVQSLEIEGSKFLAATLSSGLKDHLHSLQHLTSMQISGFHLRYGSHLLRWFPSSLLSLDVGSCRFTGSLGKPHQGLTEIHVQNLGNDTGLLSELHLQVQSSPWAMLHTTHANHLRRLYISSAHTPSAAAHDFKDFESLSELWLPINILTDGAIRHAETKGGLLKVFPLTLEVLVLSDSQDVDRRGWDFSPLKHLRSLGLQYVAMELSRSKLPSFLRTIAVSDSWAAQLRNTLSGHQGFLHIVVMHMHEWGRGLSTGGLLFSASEANHSATLTDLQVRQRVRDARHKSNLSAPLQRWLHKRR